MRKFYYLVQGLETRFATKSEAFRNARNLAGAIFLATGKRTAIAVNQYDQSATERSEP